MSSRTHRSANGEIVMLRRVMGVLMGFVLWSAVSMMEAGVYDVSATTGNDVANGSTATPWQTLAKANGSAVAGDVIVVHAGQYSDGIHPANSGQAGNSITFQAAPGEH